MSGRRFVFDRADEESPQAFAAFAAYRDMGTDRSIERVSRECRKSVSLCNRWSQRHGWVERAAAYDAHMDAERIGGAEKAAHDEGFQRHLADLRAWATTSHSVVASCLKVAGRSLEAFAQLPAEAVTVGETASLIRSALALSEAAFNADALALGLNEKLTDA